MPSVRRRVRGGEDLFRGHIRDVLDPARFVLGGEPPRGREETDCQVRPRPAIAERVETAVVQHGRSCGEPRDVLLPGAHRVRFVEAHRRRDGSPEPLNVGLAEDLLRPAGAGEGDDRPVAEAARQPKPGLRDGPHAGARDPASVKIGEELRLRVAADREQRTAFLAQVVEALHEPRRRPAELLLGGMEDVRPAHVLVRVGDIDEAGARRIRLLGDRADERCVLGKRVDREALPGLHVDPDLNREPRVGGERLLHRHVKQCTCRPAAGGLTTIPAHGSPRARRRRGRHPARARRMRGNDDVHACQHQDLPHRAQRADRRAAPLTSSPAPPPAERWSRNLGDNYATVAFGQDLTGGDQHRARLHAVCVQEHPERAVGRPPPLQQRSHPLAHASERQRPRARRRLPALNLRTGTRARRAATLDVKQRAGVAQW